MLRPLSATRVAPAPEREPLRKEVISFAIEDPRQPPELARVSKLRGPEEVELVKRVHAELTQTLGASLEASSPAAIRQMVNDRFGPALENAHVNLSRLDRVRIQEAVINEIVGFGPIQDLLEDGSVSEVMANGAEKVWIEREGRLYLTDIRFSDNDHLIRIIQRIIAPLGRRCDESSPMVDARLPDGSRVNAVIPPLSLTGPVLTIRKFRRVPLSPTELIRNGTLTPEALRFLKACVKGRLNIIIAGGSGAGKTTLLNMLSSYISNGERIVSIEDAAELKLQQDHIITLETRPSNVEGLGEVTIRDLFRNALRMRPDRIVIGECRGAEALDMLQAMNTGHDGSLTTIHANGPRDALSRIETMVLMSGADLPLKAIREQVGAAIDVVLYVERLQDGTRRVTQISEVSGLEQDLITMQDIFTFERGPMVNGRVQGAMRPTGIRPSFSDQLIARGIELPASWFGYEKPDRPEPART